MIVFSHFKATTTDSGGGSRGGVSLLLVLSSAESCTEGQANEFLVENLDC